MPPERHLTKRCLGSTREAPRRFWEGQSLRVPRDYAKALLNHKDGDVSAIYARWHMFDEKREATLAIEAAVLPLMPAPAALAA